MMRYMDRAVQLEASNPFRGEFVKSILLSTIAALLFATASHAQLTRGAILGSVQDPSGAVIANASVKIVNNATQAERTTTTNDAGLYRFDGVDPGVYSAAL